MAQIDPVVGDLDCNAELILANIDKARGLGSELVVLPELALTGYPPEDLLHKPHFIDDNLKKIEELAAKVDGITAIVGFVDRAEDNPEELLNAAAIIHNGKIIDRYYKIMLPNYGVFDEMRYFSAGKRSLCIRLNQITIGIGICEDIWHPDGPIKAQVEAGAELVININASPFHTGKAQSREKLLTERAKENNVVIAYNNMVGGQDELVFDGNGMIIDTNGRVISRAAPFVEELLTVDLVFDKASEEKPEESATEVRITPIEQGGEEGKEKAPLPKRPEQDQKPLSTTEEILMALELGTKDYATKNGFKHAILALSGGIDSALVATIARRVLGAENITAVYMPSRYSSASSKADAEQLSQNLGIEFMTIEIDDIFASYLALLKGPFKGEKEGTAEENLQARIRGNIIMALSNKFGHLVLTTGNKSETGVGYATLYGDMAGGFAIIKDVSKTLVYELARHINKLSASELIPETIINKEPSAELRADQKDRDTLPPYDQLDPILRAYVEEDKDIDSIREMGFPKELVRKIIDMVDRSEYKRRQAPPGIKITPRAYGKDWRMPITNGYEDKS